MRRSSSKKADLTFVCTECGHTSPKWEGRCSACNAWGTYAEYHESKPSAAPVRTRLANAASPGSPAAPGNAVGPIGAQSLDSGKRLPTGSAELDRLLGGGLVPGSVVLLAGDPGIGKSTLLLQSAAHLAKVAPGVLYVSGEESGGQVRLRAERLGLADSGVLFLAETSADALVEGLQQTKPSVLVVDSIQTLTAGHVPGGAGTVAQVRECAQALIAWAKAAGAPVLLAGHVTKDGAVAGPRVLEHMVDVVVQMEGDGPGAYRLLHATKNRFGATSGVALLEMRQEGLVDVADPSAALIGERQRDVPGSAVTVALEGTRPLLAEVQALTNPSAFSPPRRTSNGIDFNRTAMLAAVLSRRAALALGTHDIMVNVPGALRIGEPAADLATALAIASSYRDVALDPATVFIGEVGLNGEVRRVPQLERRLEEAARHGFRRALVPAGSATAARNVTGIGVDGVADIREALRTAMGAPRAG